MYIYHYLHHMYDVQIKIYKYIHTQKHRNTYIYTSHICMFVWVCVSVCVNLLVTNYLKNSGSSGILLFNSGLNIGNGKKKKKTAISSIIPVKVRWQYCNDLSLNPSLHVIVQKYVIRVVYLCSLHFLEFSPRMLFYGTLLILQYFNFIMENFYIN